MAVDTYALITLAQLKTELSITVSTYDTLLEDSIDRATGVIESYTRRLLKTRHFYEWHNAGSQPTITVKNTPISSVYYVAHGNRLALTVSSTTASDLAVILSVDELTLRVTRRIASGSDTTSTFAWSSYDTASELVTALNATSGISAVLGTDCPSRWIRRIGGRDLKRSSVLLEYPDLGDLDAEIDHARGTIYLRGDAPKKNAGVFVEYDGGYSTIPYDLERAAILLATRYFTARNRDTGVTNQSLGDYSESYAQGDALDLEVRTLLSPYRRLR